MEGQRKAVNNVLNKTVKKDEGTNNAVKRAIQKKVLM